MTKRKTATAAMPEGPYGSGGTTPEGIIQNRDIGRFMDFFVQLQEEAKRSFDLSDDQREMLIILDLINKHFAGRLVTSSSLAANSGLSYGTAIRNVRHQHQLDRMHDLNNGGFLAHRSRMENEDETEIRNTSAFVRAGCERHKAGDTETVFS